MPPCISIGYVPPKIASSLHPQSFWDNIHKFKHSLPLHLYSDDPSWGLEHRIANPEVVRARGKWWSVNNCIFLFGLDLALRLEAEWLIYLEADCRVGCHNWDGLMWQEFLSKRNAKTIWAGHPAVHNINADGPVAEAHVLEFCRKYQAETGWRVPIIRSPAWMIGRVDTRLLFYPNGCGGIYNIDLLRQWCPNFQQDIGRYAMKISAWDCHFGVAALDAYGPIGVVERTVGLKSVHSSYSDNSLPMDARKELLRTGRCSLVHQIKSDFCP